MAVNAFVFDAQFYAQQNNDVAAAVSQGVFPTFQDHYNQFGRFEQRDPNAFFDTSYYLSEYPDVAESGLNPFQHFMQFGAAEGRFSSQAAESTIDTDGDGRADEFDEAEYRAQNSDVDAAITNGSFQSAYQHYVLFGQFENRPGAQLNNDTALNGPIRTDGGTGAGGGNAGQTFTLTTGQDDYAGTSANDTILGLVDGSANTLTLGDVINGGAGVDSLNITSDQATVNMAVATVSNVEMLDVNMDATAAPGNTGTDANAGTVNLNSVAYTKATIEGVTGDDDATADSDTLTVNNANLATRVVLEDITDVASTVNFSGAAGGSDTATVEVAGSTDTTGGASANNSLTVANVETLNLAFTTAANNLSVVTASAAKTVNVTVAENANTTLNGAAALAAATAVNIAAAGDLTLGDTANLANGAAITVTGAGDVDLNTLDTGGDGITLNASAATGAITVTGAADTVSISTGTGGDTVTAGAITTKTTLDAGNDTFNTGGLDFGGATAVNVDAGEGTDTLNVDNGAEYDAAAVAHFKNFESLDIGGGQGSYDADLLALESVVVNSDLTSVATITDLTDEAVRIAATTTSALTLELDDNLGLTDALSFTIEGAAVDTGADGDTSNDTNDLSVAEVVTAGIETVTVVSNTASTNEAGVENTLSVLATDATKVVVNGNHALEIADFQDDTSSGVNTDTTTIDASGSTGGLIMGDFLSGSGVSLIGSEVADTLLVGTVTGLAAGDAANISTGSTINAGKGGDIVTITDDMTGANAADTIIIESGDSQIGFTDTNDSDSYTAAADAESFDIVTGFTSGEDTIDLGSFGFSGQKASGIASVSVSEAQALALVDGTTTTIANFFVDTGVARGVAVASGGDYSDIGLSGTNDSLVFVDSNGNGNLDIGVDEMVGLAGTASLALADFGF